jgi:hypothetical protein
MHRTSLALFILAAVTSGAPANFTVQFPTGGLYNHDAAVAAYGTCNANEQGALLLQYDPGGGAPVETWQSVNLTGTASGTWSETLNVPASGYWHDLGQTKSAQVKADPPNGAAGQRTIMIKDKP